MTDMKHLRLHIGAKARIRSDGPAIASLKAMGIPAKFAGRFCVVTQFGTAGVSFSLSSEREWHLTTDHFKNVLEAI